MTIKEFFASLVPASFKSDEQIFKALAEAKTRFEAVDSLFAAAGLNLEQMLAGGSDALKLHLESLNRQDEIDAANAKATAAEARVTEMEGYRTADATEKETLRTERNAAKAVIETNTPVLSAFGFKAEAKPEDNKAALDEYVAKQSAMVLAKDGRPPVAENAAPKPIAASSTAIELNGFARVQAAFEAEAEKKANA